MKLSRRERTLVEFAGIYSAKSGIAMDFGFSKLAPKERLTVCLIRGILVFLCLFGTVGLFIDTFELPCHIVMLAIISLVFSLLIAFLYYSYWAFNIGYVAFFAIFIGVTILTARYSNSGMNAIINLVMKVVDEKLNLKGVRVYTEFFSNRTLTITCCMLNILALLLCLFNNAISGACSPFLTFLLVFPLTQVCIYLKDSVNYFYVGMILCGFLGVVLLRYSNRYKMPMKGLAKNVTIKKNRITRRAERFVFTMRQMLVASAVLTVVCLVFGGLLVNAAPKYMKNNYSTLKNETDTVVKQIAVSGFAGLFNRYQSTGGLNEGKLGGVRSVSFDSETDLIVEHVPDNVNGLYLRGFVGDRYQDNSWKPAIDSYYLSDSPYNMSPSDITDALETETNILLERAAAGKEKTATAHIRVTNVDATMFYHYAPYYSMIALSSNMQGDYRDTGLRQNAQHYSYFPISQMDDLMEHYQDFEEILAPYRSNDAATKMYQRYVHSHYISLPDSVREVAEQIAEEKLTGTDTLTVVRQLMKYFETEFTYTLQPGITPRGKDFVTYFLTKQKKGLCAHFASAATVLLRAKGIPARYVEGYYMQYDDALEMTEVEGENPEDWYWGYNGTLQEGDTLAVMKANVTDASAHAWTEIYIDGFGWYPLDFTVADFGDSVEDGSFWSRFGGLLGFGDENYDSPVVAVAGGIRNAAPFVLIVILVAAGAALVLYVAIRIRRMYRLYHVTNNKRLVYQYTALTKLLKKFEKVEEKNIYHRNMVAYLTEKIDADPAEIARYIGLVEEASFGNRSLTVEELTEATTLFRKIFKRIRAGFTRRERFRTMLTY